MAQLGNGNIKEQQAAERRLREQHGIPHIMRAIQLAKAGKIPNGEVRLDVFTAYGQDKDLAKALKFNS